MKTKFCLLDADYEESTIKLIGVDESGKSILILDEFQPYFYVLPKNKTAIMKKLKTMKIVSRIEEVRRKISSREEEILKIFVDLPQNTTNVRDLIKKAVIDCFEYNITFYKQYLNERKLYPFDWLEVDGDEVKLENNKFDKIIKARDIKKIERKIQMTTIGRLSTLPKLKILAFDIEVVDNKIIMISLTDNRGFERVLTYKKTNIKNVEVLKNEEEMLLRFENIINERDPDIICGYNSDQFDFSIIQERCGEYKIDMKINRDGTPMRFVRRARISATRLRGRVHIDLFNFINNIISTQLQSEVFTLAEVSQELLGETKEELSLEELIGAWKSNRIDDLVKYCLNDSKLTLKLANTLLSQIFELSKISGQLPFDCSRLTYGLLVEWFLIRKARELGIISPNTPHWDEIQRRRELRPYKGGYVKEPKQGLHDNIAVFDFRSLYPSIIVTFNISPETLNCGHKGCKSNRVPEFKYHFCKKVHGFIPKQIKYLIEKRIEIKKKMKISKSAEWQQLNEEQTALKILANASYGYFAYPASRWYSRECAESSAAFGRDNIKKSISSAEKFGFDVLYADTDSLFVKLKGKNKIESSAEKFLEKINKSLPGMLELELQGIYVKGLFVPQRLGTYVAKKRYALIDKKGNLTIRGLETVRRDWCDVARQLQHDVIRLVLTGKEKEAVQRVRDVVKKVKSRKIDLKDITIRTQLGKSLEEYKTTAPHVAVAKKLQKAGHEVREGMVLSYIITKSKREKKESISERAEPIDRVDLSNYDIEYYLKNQIISVALRVLSVFGYKEEDFLKDGLGKFVRKK